jgi:ferrochelatase
MNEKLGVLLCNLGTPAAPTTKAVRTYLAEFLSDPRVVEIPRWLWLPILHGIILRIRPKRSAALYQKIWTLKGSPLLVHSQNLVKALQQELHNLASTKTKNDLLRGGAGEPSINCAQQFIESRKRQDPAPPDFKDNKLPIQITLGMRYGQPSIEQALTTLQQANCNKILVLPLFPQYSAATTASIFDAVANILKKWRTIPAIQTVTQYYNHPAYIAAIANSIQQHWQQQGQQQHLLFSYHGLPQRCVDLGDPYQQQCLSTAQLVAEQLELIPGHWSVVFQSRFGRAQWLQPYCDKTLQAMPAKGIKSVSVICPGFAVDCLETLEEINQLNRELFLQAGGKEFHYITCLNDSMAQVELLNDIIINNFCL